LLNYKRMMDSGGTIDEKIKARLLTFLRSIASDPQAINTADPKLIEDILNGLKILPSISPVDFKEWRQEQDAKLEVLRSL